MKIIAFWLKCHIHLVQGVELKWTVTSSEIGLAPKWRLFICWTHDGLFYWLIHAPPALMSQKHIIETVNRNTSNIYGRPLFNEIYIQS